MSQLELVNKSLRSILLLARDRKFGIPVKFQHNMAIVKNLIIVKIFEDLGQFCR